MRHSFLTTDVLPISQDALLASKGKLSLQHPAATFYINCRPVPFANEYRKKILSDFPSIA
jgi:hypothetical protein